MAFDFTIIGGGIVGLASAYQLSRKFPNKTIHLIEKETVLAKHQTGHNSGVIHSGLYYKPGSYKAKNCVDGRRALVSFAKEHHIPHDICGKIIVATDTSELDHMNKAFNNGLANGVEGIEKIDSNKIREIEPHCVGIEGIYVPCTGIIDFAVVCKKYAELTLAANPNNKISMGEEVIGIDHNGEIINLKTVKQVVRSKYMINCTGLHSDRIAMKDGLKPKARIVGFRGDYYDLSEKGKSKVRNLIYPVPNPKFPFLGVHFTRMIDGTIECGPNAVFSFKREGYGKTDFNVKDTVEALSFIGTWRLFFKHWQFGLDEYKRAFSKRLFLNRLRKLIPDLQMDDIQPGRAGVRAMALGADGEMIDDFSIQRKENALHILNAPSPAATASLAIGDEISKRALELMN
ncbi:MAG: L-2-hydroxyglutarate oxidase [Bacteroidia bacterium]|nr:L-2-hydroxyglutarate oxidase [Bacteroidia bacterium]